MTFRLETEKNIILVAGYAMSQIEIINIKHSIFCLLAKLLRNGFIRDGQ